MTDIEAGPDLDRLVAEHVMGALRTWVREPADCPPRLWWEYAPGKRDELPAFSASMSAAWLVVERMHALGHDDFGVLPFHDPGPGWLAGASEVGADQPWAWVRAAISVGWVLRWVAWAETAPVAICRAALRIVEADAVQHLPRR